jgi:hypothetical protein
MVDPAPLSQHVIKFADEIEVCRSSIARVKFNGQCRSVHVRDSKQSCSRGSSSIVDSSLPALAQLAAVTSAGDPSVV